MIEQIINILGICPKGVTLSRSNVIREQAYAIMMEPITEEEEKLIDDSVDYYKEIRHVKSNGDIITSKNIYLYGEVDFDNEDDIENIKRYNLIDMDINACNWIYSNFDFENGCFTTINGISKFYPTWDALLWFMYNYVLIGKPKRIIVYKKPISKSR